MNIGIVLSGGSGKGAYQIGALRALDNFIHKTDIACISSSSVGCLNGYAYANNRLDLAEEMWHNICKNDTRMFVTRILRSSLLQQSIKQLYTPEDKLDFDFYVSLFDFNRRTLVYKNMKSVEGSLVPKYLKASVAMPIYNKSVPVGNSFYYDGALVDNIPVFPLLKKQLDYIICVYFDTVGYKFESSSFDDKIIKIYFPTQKITESLCLTDNGVSKMITDGYDRTSFVLNSLFSRGYDDLDYIYKGIKLMNNDKSTLRITGDILATGTNKIIQKFTKRKIYL